MTRINSEDINLKQIFNASKDLQVIIDFDYPVAKIVQQQHERIDGSGYPFGLKGKLILLEAKNH